MTLLVAYSSKKVFLSMLVGLLFLLFSGQVNGECTTFRVRSTCGHQICGVKCANSGGIVPFDYYPMNCGADIFSSLGYQQDVTESCGGGMDRSATSSEDAALLDAIRNGDLITDRLPPIHTGIGKKVLRLGGGGRRSLLRN